MSLASASPSTFRACQDLTLDRLHDEFILSSKQNVVNALNRLPCFLGSPWFNCYLNSITRFFSKQRIHISAFLLCLCRAIYQNCGTVKWLVYLKTEL